MLDENNSLGTGINMASKLVEVLFKIKGAFTNILAPKSAFPSIKE